MIFVYGAITLCGVAFQQLLLITQLVTFLVIYISTLQPLISKLIGLGFSHFARRYYENTFVSFCSSGY